MLRCSFTLSGLFALLVGCTFPVVAAAEARVSETYGKLPLHFEANQGQMHEDVRFLSRGPGYSLYLTNSEAVLVLSRANADAKRDARSTQVPSDTQAKEIKAVALRMSLVGAARNPLVSGIEELPGKANYFIGKDPSKWHTNVATYAKVRYREVYPGIDLVYYGNQRQLEYDFVVAPGADPRKIVLGFRGAEKLEIDAHGELVLRVPEGAIRQKKPVIYQEVEGIRQEIDGGYVLKGPNQVGFEVAVYDRSRPLVIDPVVLSYSTYLGGSSTDAGEGIAVDAAGNAYVVGLTVSANFPTTLGGFQPTFSGGWDAFVTKLNPTGSAVVYSTYLGGSNDDRGFGIAVDTTGNAYVTGGTESTDFPTTAGAFRTSTCLPGLACLDVFVTQLDVTGSALVYSTYIGGGLGVGIAVDSDGNAYVTGWTVSTNFPTTPGAYQPTIRQGSVDGVEAFVTKLNQAGSGLVYSTYLGGTRAESGYAIALDASGHAYLTGFTNSTDFPTTAGAFQTTGGSPRDAFVTKLNPTGSGLVYSTYLAGDSDDEGFGIAVDAAGNAYVTGHTFSIDFPTTVGSFQPIKSVGYDVFVTKVNPTGSALVYSTYLGGIDRDQGWDIAVDTAGNAYVTGLTESVNFPTTVGAIQPIRGDILVGDAFVTKLNPTGSSLIYSTCLGGSGDDLGFGIALDTEGNTCVTGASGSTNFPTTPGAFQPAYSGGAYDAFVAKIVEETPPPPTPTTRRFEENAATYTGRWTSYGAETGTFSGDTILASNEIGATATFSFTGTAVAWIGVKCAVCGIATVSIDSGLPTTVNTAGPASSNFTSEPVFSASGLDPAVPHTMVITVTGTTTSVQAAPFGSHIAVDAFDVTQ